MAPPLMRVLVVHGGSDLYGSGLACAWVVEGAREAGIDVEVVLPRPGPLSDRLGGLVPVHLIDPVPLRQASLAGPTGLLEPARWLPHAARLRALGRRGRFDLVHANTAPAIGGAVAARAAGCPLVWSVHEILRFPAPLVSAYERVLGRAAVILTCSRAAADQFQRAQTRSRCRVVHTGAHIPEGLPHAPLLERPEIRMLTIGRLTAWKGHDLAVRAVPLLRDAGVQAELRIVGGSFAGDRRHEDELRDLVGELGVSDHVALLGERDDVWDLLATSDVFLQPSRSPEPFGIALVEAMAMGRVCVASAHGGPVEILSGGSGYLVRPDDARALADAVADVDGDRERARMTARRAREAAAGFRAEIMVEQVIDVYRAVAAGLSPV